MNDTPTSPAPKFIGWLRQPGGNWQPVCRGDNFDAVWSALLGVAGNRQHDERQVLRNGEKPEARPGRPRRRY